MVQLHTLKGDCNLLIPYTHPFASFKNMFTDININLHLFSSKCHYPKEKKMALIQSPREVIVAWNDFLFLHLCMPCPVTRHVHPSCTKSLSTIHPLHSEALIKHYVLSAQDVLLEPNPCKRALFKHESGPCLTSSFLHK